MWNPSDYEDEQQDRSHSTYMNGLVDLFNASLKQYTTCCNDTKKAIDIVSKYFSIKQTDIDFVMKYLEKEENAKQIHDTNHSKIFSQIDGFEYVSKEQLEQEKNVEQLHTSNKTRASQLEVKDKLEQPTFFSLGLMEDPLEEKTSKTKSQDNPPEQ